MESEMDSGHRSFLLYLKARQVLRGQRVEGVKEVHANRRGVRGIPPHGDDAVPRQVSDLYFEVRGRPDPFALAARH